MKARHALGWMALLASAAASAQVPVKLGYQGRLLKADGTPEVGVVDMTFAIFDSDLGGNPLWSETQHVALTNGLYSTFLGEVTAIPSTVLDGSVRYLEIGLADGALTPRQRIGSVPYALRATSASQVSGGPVDATSISVSGAPVIDSAGHLAGAARYSAGPGIDISAAGSSSGTVSNSGLLSLGVAAGGPLSVSSGQNPVLTLGTLGVASGGTGLTTAPTAQQFLRGNGAGGWTAGRIADADLPVNVAVIDGAQTFSALQSFAPAGAGAAPFAVAANATGQVANLNAERVGGLAKSDLTNASSLSSGTVADTRLSSNVALLNASPVFSTPVTASAFSSAGNFTATGTGKFSGDGSGLTSLDAAQLIGLLGDSHLSANICRLDGSPTFAGAGGVTAASFSSAGNFTATGAGKFTGDGSALTALNATQLTGTVADARLSGNVAFLDASPSFSSPLTATALSTAGNVTATGSGKFIGDGSGLTSLEAAQLIGSLGDSHLSANICRLDGSPTFAGPGGVTAASFSSSGNFTATGTGKFTGDGSALTALNATQLTGTVADGRLSGNVVVLNSSPTFTGTGGVTAAAFSSAGNFTATGTGKFTGDGSALTALNATQLASGTVGDGRLSGNVALLDASPSFSSPLTATALSTAGNVTATGTGKFIGDGSGLTSLEAAQLIGSLGDSHLSANICRLDGSPTFAGPGGVTAASFSSSGNFTATGTGKFSGDGSALTALNATNLGSGTVADARLSSNVAVLSASPTFTGTGGVTAASFSSAGNFTATGTGKFTGDGSALTALNATQLSSGTVGDGRLSGNVALLDASPIFSSPLTATALSTAGNVTATGTGKFIGDGSGLTYLDAAQLIGGLADSHLSANICRLDGSPTFAGPGGVTAASFSSAGNFTATGTGKFTGDGSLLTALNATQLDSGTVADTRLSSNVALLGSNPTFTGTGGVTAASFSTAGNVTATGSGKFVGDGSLLTSLPAGQLSGTVAVGNGGTGATTAAGALTALGAAASGPNSDITSLAGLTFNGNVNMGSNKVTNLATPIGTSDAATRGYVDAAIAGLSKSLSISTFAASGSWTRPAGVNTVEVFLVGGGGGGGGTLGGGFGAGGGGGGGVVHTWVNVSADVAVTIGGGGAGASNGQGTNGVDSTFGALLTAKGGGGGGGGSADSNRSGLDGGCGGGGAGGGFGGYNGPGGGGGGAAGNGQMGQPSGSNTMTSTGGSGSQGGSGAQAGFVTGLGGQAGAGGPGINFGGFGQVSGFGGGGGGGGNAAGGGPGSHGGGRGASSAVAPTAGLANSGGGGGGANSANGTGASGGSGFCMVIWYQ